MLSPMKGLPLSRRRGVFEAFLRLLAVRSGRWRAMSSQYSACRAGARDLTLRVHFDHAGAWMVGVGRSSCLAATPR